MKFKTLKDNIRIEEGTEGVVFNHYSFCEMITHIMVTYGKVTYDEACNKLKNSFLIEAPTSLDDVCYITHELAYHWAMLLVHGDMYWTNGIPSDFNDFEDEYLIWETEVRREHNLKIPYEYYDI
ncbi:hypothetical protein [Aquimarina sp. SS2-1]|uniref:hypothetical protein n=1 Tax=Aquimarina besae TaxID=3342247 RepID=UPI00367152D9